jgi:hypothetical protein
VQPCTTTCPATLDLSSQLRWTPSLPHMQRLRNPPHSQGGLRCRHMYHGTRLKGRNLEHCVAYGSGSCPLLRGLWAATCLAVPCGPWATSIRKGLACLPMRQGLPAPNACSHVSKTHDISAIMILQDVRAGSAVHACKTCEQVATIYLQCSANLVDHS